MKLRKFAQEQLKHSNCKHKKESIHPYQELMMQLTVERVPFYASNYIRACLHMERQQEPEYKWIIW
jgi:hypothetical protein